jgi:hypothetical protein
MATIPIRPPDPIALAWKWGTLWGLALGMWLLAPSVLDTHRLYPDNMRQWLTVIVGVSVVFGMLGAMLTVASGFLLVLFERLVAGRFEDRTWAYALASGPLAAAGYTVNSIFIHWMNFGSLSFWTRDRVELTGAALVWFIASAVLVIFYRGVTRKASRPPLAVLGWTLAIATATGTAALVARTPRPLPRAAISGPLERLPVAAADDTPLLFIGLDGATWRVLQPAIENGSAPTLRSLRDYGVHGTIEALWEPYWSGAAWSSILTGLPRDITGVHEDLAGSGPGLPLFQVPLSASLVLNPVYSARATLMRTRLISFTPPSRHHLNGTPVWQMLHESGVASAVVRFRFTYPPAGQANIVVSDWVGEDQWERLGVRRRAVSDTVTPAERAGELLAPFVSKTPSADPYSEVLPGGPHAQPADSVLDPIHELRLAADIDQRTFDASEAIVAANPRQPFLAVYIGGLDSVEHAFWQYRFPEEFPVDGPAPADVEKLAPVIERYVRYVDRSIARLLSRYAQAPNVLIVSDHGQGATTMESHWKGWHARDGVFLMAGPSVAGHAKPIAVSYYDVLPTILHLKGFRTPAPLTGTSMVPAAVASGSTRSTDGSITGTDD